MGDRLLKFMPYVVALVVLVVIGRQCDRKSIQSESVAMYEDSKNLNRWRAPTSSELTTISRMLVANNVSGCGEYHLQEPTKGEYLIACTSDGETWNFYVAWPRVDDKVYLANDEMLKGITKPY